MRDAEREKCIPWISLSGFCRPAVWRISIPLITAGKTDPHGFYVGRDKFGSNILVDFNQRADDKTNGSILILGNSGQGKSYLLKLILCNLREAGLNVICLDPETEYEELTNNLGGCFIDLMGGRFLINPLEPKVWDEGEGPGGPGCTGNLPDPEPAEPAYQLFKRLFPFL